MLIPDSSDLTFADRHCHGFAGVDFATASTNEVQRALEALKHRGVTEVTASLPTMSPERVCSSVQRLKPLIASGILSGIHLEGPFMATGRCGAHPPHLLQSPHDPDARQWLHQLFDDAEGAITSMTYAPELPGAEQLEGDLVAAGVDPSPGHTDADADAMRTALHRLHNLLDGPVVITHLFNAMPGFHHRDPGPVPVILDAARAGDVQVELIADGHHVAPEIITQWLRLAPHSGRIVSDAASATQAPAGLYSLGETSIVSRTDGPPLVQGTTTMAAGAVDIAAAYKNLVSWGVPSTVAYQACSVQ